jgi:hypothetical protein
VPKPDPSRQNRRTGQNSFPKRQINPYYYIDGYPGYHKVEGVTLVGCWAHARRKFDEALKALPDDKQKAAVTAREGLELCNRLFAIERDIKDATAEERLKV